MQKQAVTKSKKRGEYMKLTQEVKQRNIELALISMWMAGFENAKQGGVPENFPRLKDVSSLIKHIIHI